MPPHQILVYDASGRDVAGAIGPLQEDDNLVLTCEVRGGKLVTFFRFPLRKKNRDVVRQIYIQFLLLPGN